MGSEPTSLWYDAFPSHRSDASGLASPPLQSPISVPFQWEEAPGKPRNSEVWKEAPGKPRDSEACAGLYAISIRPLVLPPKLVGLSPSIFDGPTVVCRPASRSFAFGDRTYYNRPSLSSEKRKKKERLVLFRRREVRGGSGSDSLPASAAASSGMNGSAESRYYWKELADYEGGGGEIDRVSITRFGKGNSLLNGSGSTMHIWASIYGGLKQVVPWRAKKLVATKMRMDSQRY